MYYEELIASLYGSLIREDDNENDLIIRILANAARLTANNQDLTDTDEEKYGTR